MDTNIKRIIMYNIFRKKVILISSLLEETMEKYIAEAIAKAKTEAVVNILSVGLSKEVVQDAYPEQFAVGKERFLQNKKSKQKR